MPDQSALDLNTVDPSIWRILIKDTVYGPYTLGQLQGFIAEGRLGLHTKIAEGDGAAFVTAETIAPLQPALRANLRSKTVEAEQEGKLQNYLIVSRLGGAGEVGLVRLLNSFGQFGEALPGIFLLSSAEKLGTIQKALQDQLNVQDKIIIVNASMNRIGWFNLGPEADIHLRSIWQTNKAI